jgi:pilus assembly protein FimV
VLLTLKWASGSITKTYTLLIGDTQQLIVKPGQTLSGIAEQMAPQLNGATLDQTMLALFKTNPDAFASGSINRLLAGATLNKPSQALIRSISPAEANQFVADAYAQFDAQQGNQGAVTAQGKNSINDAQMPAKDLLKIGSNIDGNADERRYTEELVAQEKALEQTKAKLAELEKNIADLQRLLNKSKAQAGSQNTIEQYLIFGTYTPALLALALLLFAGIVLWLLAKNARKTEVLGQVKVSHHTGSLVATQHAHSDIPQRTKALLDGIDLELSPKKSFSETQSNPLADTLRVKLNLARAYITIEDFAAATKSLDEIVLISNTVDPAITIQAKALLAEIAQRQS